MAVAASCSAGEFGYSDTEVCIRAIQWNACPVSTNCYFTEISVKIKKDGIVQWTDNNVVENGYDPFTTPICGSSITIEMIDSYGDGWNGATVDVLGTLGGEDVYLATNLHIRSDNGLEGRVATGSRPETYDKTFFQLCHSTKLEKSYPKSILEVRLIIDSRS